MNFRLFLLLYVFLFAAAAKSATLSSVCEETSSGVRLVRGDRVLWNLELAPPEGKPFIHPLTLPDGTVLTEIRPADHVWHFGLWFSWKYINGVNFWEPKGHRSAPTGGVTRVRSHRVVRHGESADVSFVLDYASGQTPDRPFLTESRRVLFTTPDAAGSFRVACFHVFTAVSDVTLGRTPPYRRGKKQEAWAGGYAGLTLRLNKDAAERLSLSAANGGTNQLSVVGRERRHVELRTRDGHGVRIEQTAGPDVSAFYLWPDLRFINPSPVWSGEIKLSAGDRLELAYRVLIF